MRRGRKKSIWRASARRSVPTSSSASQRFATTPQLASSDVDLGRLQADRMRQNTFGAAALRHRADVERFRHVEFSLPLPAGKLRLARRLEKFPYVPSDAANRNYRCEEV